jgi:UDP-2,3-diacylglucosamine pyrophosphatase LpxH
MFLSDVHLNLVAENRHILNQVLFNHRGQEDEALVFCLCCVASVTKNSHS